MKRGIVFLWGGVAGVSLLLLAVVEAAMAQATIFPNPPPGSVYKEYRVHISNYDNSWRVTDPSTASGQWAAQVAPFLPNPTLNVNSVDLSGATRAEALFSLWGGHVGTTNKRVRFNGNSWITIPEIQAVPAGTNGRCYMSQYMVGVDVPLGHLLSGTNSFEGTCGDQDCHGFHWGQFGWYGMVLRVYYDPAAKTHVTGSVTAPTTGAQVGENATLSVNATGGVSQVDFLAHYEGYDTDGDGVFLEYHHDYHRGPNDASVQIRNHAGSATGGGTSTTWNNTWVPDQGNIKILARIQGTNGVWYVTPEVTGITLARSNASVRMFKPYNVGEKEWTRDSHPPIATSVNISTLDGAVKAVAMITTWNGVDGQSDGAPHYWRLNGNDIGMHGADHYYAMSVIDLPSAILKTGENTFELSSLSVHHGIELMWPGPAVLVRYGTVLSVTLASFAATHTTGSDVEVTWVTISETNNHGFDVQKTTDLQFGFQTVEGSFQAGQGTTTDTTYYSYLDKNAGPGTLYYRLQQRDLDGTVHYSEPIQVTRVTSAPGNEVPAAYSLTQAYPNPFNPTTRIRFGIPQAVHVRLRLFNHLGQAVRVITEGMRAAGYHEVTLNAEGLPSGIYYYRLEAGSFSDTKKVVLLR